jgi:hypothetical protein
MTPQRLAHLQDLAENAPPAKLRKIAANIIKELHDEQQAHAQLRVDFDEANLERSTLKGDLRIAAGELRIPIPEPGTIMAQMLTARMLMRREIDELRKENQELRDANSPKSVMSLAHKVQAVMLNSPSMRLLKKTSKIVEELDYLAFMVRAAQAKKDKKNARNALTKRCLELMNLYANPPPTPNEEANSLKSPG